MLHEMTKQLIEYDCFASLGNRHTFTRLLNWYLLNFSALPIGHGDYRLSRRYLSAEIVADFCY